VASDRYHIDTIAGWAWGWVRRYPISAGYEGSLTVADWNAIYACMTSLLQMPYVQYGILNSYAGVIVDEYQDCTLPMHRLIIGLKRLLPCRVLGDELQGVFAFNEPLINWADVQREFVNNLGPLEVPYRWKQDGCDEKLGEWMLLKRSAFKQEREPDYSGSPVRKQTVQYADAGKALSNLINALHGSVCVIGSKTHRLPKGLETILVRRGFCVLEQNELVVLRDVVEALADGTQAQKEEAVVKFFFEVYGGISPKDRAFVTKILTGAKQRPQGGDRRRICDRHMQGISPELLIDLLGYVAQKGVALCKLRESARALRAILKIHIETGAELTSLYADEIARRKYGNHRDGHFCIGSTLLVKGLEFDHAVVIRPRNWQKNWGSYRDLYVALTRGSKSVSLFEIV
jgi:DNA helicase-2/ATP-dependent DNA helicase PcrA